MTESPVAPGPDPQAESADLVDYALLRDYGGFVLRAPRRHKLLAAACFVAVGGAALAALSVLPKRYEVRAQILAQPNPLLLEFNQYDAPTRAARETILQRENIVALLEQTDFVARHAAKRVLAARAKEWLLEEVRGRRTPAQRLDDCADAVEERLHVEVSNTGTIDVVFRWSDAALAFDFVEAALQRYLEARHSAEVSRIAETISILEEHAARVGQDVAEKTKQLQAMERKSLASRPRGVARPSRGLPDAELMMLQARATGKRRTLADLEEYRARRLSELQTELQQQETIYAEKHPALEATRRNIEALSRPSPRSEALRGEIAGLEREMSRREASLVESGGGKTDAPGAVPTRSVFPLDVQEDPFVEYERQKLWMLVRQQATLHERIDSAREVMDTARAGFRYRYSIIRPPRMPRGPVQPNAARIVLAGLAGGVLLAFAASAAADLRRGLLVERWQVERGLELPVLAELRPRR